MDKLPHELLHQIFIELTLMQKQECMYVCPLWRDIIRERSLFHTLYVPNWYVYNKLVNLVQREPTLAKQVEYIKIQQTQKDYCNTVWLLDLFPYLREIKITHLAASPITMVTREFDPITRKGHITYLKDTDWCKLTDRLLDNEQCQHLISLSLDLQDWIDVSKTLSAVLVKMPNLRHLLLEGAMVSINDCETISANAPLLESLELHRTIAATSSELPRVIEPALSLKKFTINLGQLNNEIYQLAWPKYIWKKYHSLEHLEFFADSSASAEDIRCFYEQGCKTLFEVFGNKLKTLGFLNLGACEEDDVVKYISALGHRLTTLKIQSRGLDDTIVRALEGGSQASLLEHLVLKDIHPSSFDWLSSLVKLNKFELYGDKWESDSSLHIELYDIFAHMSQTVKTAVIHLCQAKTTLPRTPKQLSIENLEFSISTPSIGIDDLISSCFPKLKRLTLNYCFQPNTMVKLQKFRLLYLEIKHMSNLSLTVGRNTYYYTMRPERKTKHIKDFTNLSEEYSPVLLDAVRSEDFLHVICRRVGTFVFNDVPVSFLPLRPEELQELDDEPKSVLSKIYNIIR